MNHLKIFFLTLILLLPSLVKAQKADVILGNWKATDKILTIHIYKHGEAYHGKIVSFKDRHHPESDPAKKLDEHNPNPALRKRHLIGMDILTGLRYHAKSKGWEDGSIYNPQKGNSYSVSVKITGDKMELRAYKGISMLGKTMTFVRE